MMKRQMRFRSIAAAITAAAVLILAGCGGSPDETGADASAPVSPSVSVEIPSPTPTPSEVALPQLNKTYKVAGAKHTCESFLTNDGIEIGNGCIAFLQGSWDAYAPAWDKYAAQAEKGAYGKGIQIWSRPRLAFASFFACAASYGNEEARASYPTRPDLLGAVNESSDFVAQLWDIAHVGLCPKDGPIKAAKADGLPTNRAALIGGKRISCGEFFFAKQKGSCGDQPTLSSWRKYYDRIPAYYGDLKAGKTATNFSAWGTDALTWSLQACDPTFAPDKRTYVKNVGLGGEYDTSMGQLYDVANKGLCPGKK